MLLKLFTDLETLPAAVPVSHWVLQLGFAYKLLEPVLLYVDLEARACPSRRWQGPSRSTEWCRCPRSTCGDCDSRLCPFELPCFTWWSMTSCYLSWQETSVFCPISLDSQGSPLWQIVLSCVQRRDWKHHRSDHWPKAASLVWGQVTWPEVWVSWLLSPCWRPLPWSAPCCFSSRLLLGQRSGHLQSSWLRGSVHSGVEGPAQMGPAECLALNTCAPLLGEWYVCQSFGKAEGGWAAWWGRPLATSGKDQREICSKAVPWFSLQTSHSFPFLPPSLPFLFFCCEEQLVFVYFWFKEKSLIIGYKAVFINPCFIFKPPRDIFF